MRKAQIQTLIDSSRNLPQETSFESITLLLYQLSNKTDVDVSLHRFQLITKLLTYRKKVVGKILKN